tara:strand:- start:28 stop:219 length:192 start_codon:yes stop_codon:yes gene_type:complete
MGSSIDTWQWPDMQDNDLGSLEKLRQKLNDDIQLKPILLLETDGFGETRNNMSKVLRKYSVFV